jgi:hypothetical protein
MNFVDVTHAVASEMKRYGQYEERTPRVPPEFLQEIVVHIIGTIRKCKATYEVAIALT